MALAERRDAIRLTSQPSPDVSCLSVPKSPLGFNSFSQRPLQGLSSQSGAKPSGFAQPLAHRSTTLGALLSSGLKSPPGLVSSSPKSLSGFRPPKSTCDKPSTVATESSQSPAAGSKAMWKACYTVAGQTYTISVSVPSTMEQEPERLKDPVTDTSMQKAVSRTSGLGSVSKPADAKALQKQQKRGRSGDEGNSVSAMEQPAGGSATPSYSSASSSSGSSAVRRQEQTSRKRIQPSPKAGPGPSDIASATRNPTAKADSFGAACDAETNTDGIEIFSGCKDDDDDDQLPRSFFASPPVKQQKRMSLSKKSSDVSASSPKTSERLRLAEERKKAGTQISSSNSSEERKGRKVRTRKAETVLHGKSDCSVQRSAVGKSSR